MSNRAGRARGGWGARGAGRGKGRRGRGRARRRAGRAEVAAVAAGPAAAARLSLAGSALPGSGPQVCPSGMGRRGGPRRPWPSWGSRAAGGLRAGRPRPSVGRRGRDPGRPRRLSSRPREALVPGGRVPAPRPFPGLGRGRGESPAHPPPVGRAGPTGDVGRDEAGLPDPRGLGLWSTPSRIWKRARASRMDRDPQPVSWSSDPERPWGEAASDRSDPAPAIRFLLSVGPAKLPPPGGPWRNPLCPPIPPAPLTPQSPDEFSFSPCAHSAGPVPTLNSRQRGVKDVTRRNESCFSSLNCLVLTPLRSLKTA